MPTPPAFNETEAAEAPDVQEAPSFDATEPAAAPSLAPAFEETAPAPAPPERLEFGLPEVTLEELEIANREETSRAMQEYEASQERQFPTLPQYRVSAQDFLAKNEQFHPFARPFYAGQPTNDTGPDAWRSNVQRPPSYFERKGIKNPPAGALLKPKYLPPKSIPTDDEIRAQFGDQGVQEMKEAAAWIAEQQAMHEASKAAADADPGTAGLFKASVGELGQGILSMANAAVNLVPSGIELRDKKEAEKKSEILNRAAQSLQKVIGAKNMADIRFNAADAIRAYRVLAKGLTGVPGDFAPERATKKPGDINTAENTDVHADQPLEDYLQSYGEQFQRPEDQDAGMIALAPYHMAQAALPEAQDWLAKATKANPELAKSESYKIWSNLLRQAPQLGAMAVSGGTSAALFNGAAMAFLQNKGAAYDELRQQLKQEGRWTDAQIHELAAAKSTEIAVKETPLDFAEVVLPVKALGSAMDAVRKTGKLRSAIKPALAASAIGYATERPTEYIQTRIEEWEKNKVGTTISTPAEQEERAQEAGRVGGAVGAIIPGGVSVIGSVKGRSDFTRAAAAKVGPATQAAVEARETKLAQQAKQGIQTLQDEAANQQGTPPASPPSAPTPPPKPPAPGTPGAPAGSPVAPVAPPAAAPNTGPLTPAEFSEYQSLSASDDIASNRQASERWDALHARLQQHGQAPAAPTPPVVSVDGKPITPPGEQIEYSPADTGGGLPGTGEREDGTPDPVELPTTMLSPDKHPVLDVPLSEITLSEDVPNFKEAADRKTGVVEGQELAGEYDPLGAAPIVLWERLNGAKEVITGRHRRNLAERTPGRTTIRAQIVKESDGFTKEQAIALDAESNIKDEKGTLKDFAHYFRNTRNAYPDRASAESRGLLSRTPGRDGWALGRDASDDTFAAFANGKIKAPAALAIAKAAPGNAEAQRAGLKYALANPTKSGEEIGHRMNSAAAFQAAGLVQADEQGDLFGSNDTAIAAMDKAAEVAKSLQSEANEDVKILSAALSRKGKLELTKAEATRFGIGKRDDETAIRTALQAARERASGWDSWALNPEKKVAVFARAGTAQAPAAAPTPQETPKTSEAARPAPATDLFAGKPDDVFNLTAESAAEKAARIAREEREAAAREEAERAAAVAEAERNQLGLFGEVDLAGKQAVKDVVNPPAVQTVQKAEDAGFDLFGDDVKQALSAGSIQEGWHVIRADGSRVIVLVADGIAEVAAATGKTVAERAAEIARHELVHDGQALGVLLPAPERAEYRGLLDGVIKRAGDTETADVVELYGYDPRTLPGREMIAEELLARAGEQVERPAWYDRVMAGLLRVLRKMGWSGALRDSEMRVLLDKAQMGRQAAREPASRQVRSAKRKRAQVFSKKGVGHEYEVRNVAETTDKIRSQVFDGTQAPSQVVTDAAWKLAYDWANPATSDETGARIGTVGGNEMAAGIAQAELMRYARQLTAAGNNSLEAFLNEHSNLFPSESAAGVSSAAALLRGRRVLSAPSTTAINEVNETRDELAGDAIGEDALDALRKLLLSVQLTPEEILEALGGIKTEEGQTLADALKALIGLGQAVDANPMIRAIIQIARRGYAGELDFTFEARQKKDADLQAQLAPVLMNMRAYLEKQGAEGLERDWWRGLAGPTEQGPLWTADQALQGQLSGILREAMRAAGILNEAEAAKLTDAQKVAMALGKADLRAGKINLVSESVAKEIDRREAAELEALEADTTLSDAEREGMRDATVMQYKLLRDTWEQATARMKGQPASAATVRRMIHAEVKNLAPKGKPAKPGGTPPAQTTKFWKDAIIGGNLAAAKTRVVEAVLKGVRDASGTATIGLDYTALKAQLEAAFDQVAEIQRARQEADEIGRRVAAAGRITMRPENQAQALLDSFARIQSDTPEVSKAPKANEIRELVKANIAFGPAMSEEQFEAAALKLGVNGTTAKNLYRATMRERGARQIAAANREVIKALEHGSLVPLVDQILNSPPHRQLDPEWRRNAALEYFRNAGLNDNAAAAAATSFEAQFALRLAAAREAAAEKIVRGSAKWKVNEGANKGRAISDLQRVIRAVRAGVTDPTANFAEELAKAQGWRGFTLAQHQRMAELDGIMADEHTPEHERARAGAEIMRIARRANVQPSTLRTLAAGIAMNILSGISSFMINIVSPAFFASKALIVDATLGRSPILAFRATAQRFKSWWQEFNFAIRNDAYTFGWHEYLDTSGTAMDTWLAEGWEGVKQKRPAALLKFFFGLPDIVRRIHQSLDQAAVGQANDYSKIMFASEAMKEAGATSADVHEMISLAQSQQELAYQAAIAEGHSSRDARVFALAELRNYLSYAVGEINPARAEALDAAARREGFIIVGRRDVDTQGRELHEGTGVTRGLEAIVTSISRMEQNVERAAMDPARKERTLAFVTAAKRLLFGFILVPFRVSSHVMGDMPLHGAWRAFYHKLKSGTAVGTSYQQSRGTWFQERARMRELLGNTVLLAAIASLLRPSDEPDEEKGDNWFTVTGNGPLSDDRGVKQAWAERNKPFALRGKLFGVPIEMNLGRGAETYAFALAPLGAYDDYHVAAKQDAGKSSPVGVDMAANMASNYMATLWQRAAFGAQFSRTGNVMSREYSSPAMITNWTTGFAKNALPLQRFVESTAALFAGQADISTVQNAARANIPYVGPLTAEPALNFLGDEIADDVPSRLWKAGIPFYLRVKESAMNRAAYGLILDKGQAPSVPSRKSVERSLGPLNNQTWRAYVKTYGGYVKEQLAEGFDKYDEMDGRQFNEAMEGLSKKARSFTVKDLGLEVIDNE